MASGPISINILANTREAIRGVEGVADAVEEVGDVLHDLTRDRSTEAMERDFKDLQRETDRTADVIKSKFADAYRSVRRDSDQAADEAVRSQDRMRDRSVEIGQEVRQNLGEGIANAARGDFESLADVIGDTFGGAVAGIGGVASAAVAAAGAVGLGAMVAALNAAQEKAEKLRETGFAIAESLYENRGKLPMEDQVARLFELLQKERYGRTWVGDALSGLIDLGSSMDDLREQSRKAGINVYDVFKIIGGNDGRKARDMLADIDARLVELKESVGDVPFPELVQETEGLVRVRRYLEDIVESARIADQAASAVGSSYNAEYAEKVQDLSDAWQNATQNAGDYFRETESGATEFDFTGWVARMESNIKAAATYKAELVSLPDPIRREAERIFEEQGAIDAVRFIEGFKSASPQMQQQAVTALGTIGSKSGDEFARAAEAAARSRAQGMGNIPIPLAANLSQLDYDIRNWRPPRVTISGEIRTMNGQLIR